MENLQESITDRCYTHVIRLGVLLQAVVMSVLFGCSSSPSSPSSNGNSDQAIGLPEWKLVQQELPSALLSVQVAWNGDIYAVGSDVEDGRGPYVLHFNGEQWTRLETGVTGDLWWVHQVGLDDIWMSGANRLVLRYRPSTKTFTTVDVGQGSETLYGIWGLAADDMWSVGGKQCGVVLKNEGTEWTEMKLPDLEGAQCLPPLFKVWGLSENEVWMVGERGVSLAFDGSNLNLQQTDTGRTLFTVHSDVKGDLIVAVGGQQSGEIRELIDGGWKNVTPERTRQVLGINVGANGEAVAVGDRASTVRRGSDGWVVEKNGLDAVNDLSFHAVWTGPQGNAWAVGGQLLVGPFDRGMIAYYGVATPPSEIVNGR
tara:strand:- start:96 stop:1205 length:1110 start_codon:yes stop_codon:yes gene_type:complete